MAWSKPGRTSPVLLRQPRWRSWCVLPPRHRGPARAEAGQMMIAAIYAVMMLGLLLVGCTSVIPVSKPGSSEVDWRQADYTCLRDSSVAFGPQARRLYEACLRAYGWTVGESGGGPVKRTYEYRP